MKQGYYQATVVFLLLIIVAIEYGRLYNAHPLLWQMLKQEGVAAQGQPRLLSLLHLSSDGEEKTAAGSNVGGTHNREPLRGPRRSQPKDKTAGDRAAESKAADDTEKPRDQVRQNSAGNGAKSSGKQPKATDPMVLPGEGSVAYENPSGDEVSAAVGSDTYGEVAKMLSAVPSVKGSSLVSELQETDVAEEARQLRKRRREIFFPVVGHGVKLSKTRERWSLATRGASEKDGDVSMVRSGVRQHPYCRLEMNLAAVTMQHDPNAGSDDSTTEAAKKEAIRKQRAVLPDAMQLDEEEVEYMKAHVQIGIVTGSFEKFFRVDLSLCTWLNHFPLTNVHIFTDNANMSDGRPGNWVEGVIPEGVVFSKQQLSAKGYTIHWIKAQYRFIQGLQHLVHLWKTKVTPETKWFVILDDDTFVDTKAMVRMMMSYDRKAPAPRYLGERGWGGAGHFLNREAAEVVHKKMNYCVQRYMINSFAASDVMLKKCMDVISIRKVWDDLLSHCQANFLRERMLTRRHVTMHVKREMVEPRFLAMWRLRQYYQVTYHRNLTAYNLLLGYGACAYGSCKHQRCGKAHDNRSIEVFNALSSDGGGIPHW